MRHSVQVFLEINLLCSWGIQKKTRGNYFKSFFFLLNLFLILFSFPSRHLYLYFKWIGGILRKRTTARKSQKIAHNVKLITKDKLNEMQCLRKEKQAWRNCKEMLQLRKTLLLSSAREEDNYFQSSSSIIYNKIIFRQKRKEKWSHT